MTGFWADYIGGWLRHYGSLGLDAPYMDSMGFDLAGPTFSNGSALVFGDGDGGQRMLQMMQGPAAQAYPNQQTGFASDNSSFFFTYEGYTDTLSAAGGGSLISGCRDVPCQFVCNTASPPANGRCGLCTANMSWLGKNITGLDANFEVARATFPDHAVFEGSDASSGEYRRIALRQLGHGFTDGHRADMQAFSFPNWHASYGSPILWLREAISPWIDRNRTTREGSAEYRFTEGVKHVSAPDWIVKQWSSASPQSWSMFLYFSQDSVAGAAVVEVDFQAKWFQLERNRVAMSARGRL